MGHLSEMSYAEFGKLRFLDFFPKTEYYSEDEVGGTECGIGLACDYGYGPTAFSSPFSAKNQTAEIMLDFDNACPEKEGNALLRHLGLELRMGMAFADVKQSLGIPTEEESDQTYLRYIVGKRWVYYLDCFIREHGGLFRVWICRKDLADEASNPSQED